MDANENKSDALYNALVLGGNGSSLLRECLEHRPAWRLHERGVDEQGSWNLWWGSNGQPLRRAISRLSNKELPALRAMNRLPNAHEIATKARLAYHLSRHLSKTGKTTEYIPETHVVSAKLQFGKERERLKQAAARNASDGFGLIWIVKPDNKNRGTNISLHVSMDDALAQVNMKGAVGSTWIIQKYIENPLLLAGRKFDIRSFVLISARKQVWMHSESYARTSSTRFHLHNLEDRSIHLTNDAIQSRYDHYNTFEDHNKLTMRALQEMLDAQQQNISVEEQLIPQMRNAASEIFSAALPHLSHPCSHSCFELFGLDFMVTDAGKVFIIEVNSCPALGLHGQVLQDLLPRVVEEVFQKAIDPIFPGSAADTIPLYGFQRLPVRTPRRHQQYFPNKRGGSLSPCQRLGSFDHSNGKISKHMSLQERRPAQPKKPLPTAGTV